MDSKKSGRYFRNILVTILCFTAFLSACDESEGESKAKSVAVAVMAGFGAWLCWHADPGKEKREREEDYTPFDEGDDIGANS